MYSFQATEKLMARRHIFMRHLHGVGAEEYEIRPACGDKAGLSDVYYAG